MIAPALRRVFGKYTLLERIAVGGMAEIFRATTKGIGGFEKMLAIKRLHPHYSEDQQFARMLVDEAKITVLLQHSNIVQIFDLGRVAGQYYIAMELVEGRDLFQVLRVLHQNELQMPIEAACYVAAEMCHGLHYAHCRAHPDSGEPLHVIHRDISPQNILLSWAGEVKIGDFGIVKAAMRSTVTEAGVIKGKFYYMSPEQAQGTDIDWRSDIFSAGIVLYEALTATPLYDDADSGTLLARVQRGEVRSPREVREDIPPELEAIVMRALAPDRQQRFQSAAEMGRALGDFLHSREAGFTKADLGEFLHTLLTPADGDTEEAPQRSPAERAAAARPPPLPAAATSSRAEPPMAAPVPDDDDDDDLSTATGMMPSAAPAASGPTRPLSRPHLSAAAKAKLTPPPVVLTVPVPRSETAAVKPAAEVEELTPLPLPSVVSAAMRRNRQRELGLRVALGVVAAAILAVSIAIVYVLVTPVQAAPAKAPAASPATVTPAPAIEAEAPSDAPADEDAPPEPTSGTARLEIATDRPSFGYRLWVNGELVEPERGVVTVEAGRNEVRARLLPEGVETEPRVYDLEPGTTARIEL